MSDDHLGGYLLEIDSLLIGQDALVSLADSMATRARSDLAVLSKDSPQRSLYRRRSSDFDEQLAIARALFVGEEQRVQKQPQCTRCGSRSSHLDERGLGLCCQRPRLGPARPLYLEAEDALLLESILSLYLTEFDELPPHQVTRAQALLRRLVGGSTRNAS